MINDLTTSLIAILFFHGKQFFLNNTQNLVLVSQNCFQLLNQFMKLLQFFFNLVTLQSLQSSQLHRQNCSRLNFRQTKSLHQTLVGIIITFANRLNHLVDMIKRNFQTFQYMSSFLSFSKFKLSPASNNALTMLNEFRQNLLQAHNFRLNTIDQSQDIIME